MGMVEAVKSVLTQYVGFSGRARRSEFWFWVLATILVSIALAVVELLLGLSREGNGPLSTIFSLAIFLPGLAVTFRRLHDTGRSGWWMGGFYLAVFISLIVLVSMVFGAANVAGTTLFAGLGVFSFALILGIILYAIVMLVFLCQDSVKGPNKYGPNPKDVGNYDIFE